MQVIQTTAVVLWAASELRAWAVAARAAQSVAAGAVQLWGASGWAAARVATCALTLASQVVWWVYLGAVAVPFRPRAVFDVYDTYAPDWDAAAAPIVVPAPLAGVAGGVLDAGAGIFLALNAAELRAADDALRAASARCALLDAYAGTQVVVVAGLAAQLWHQAGFQQRARGMARAVAGAGAADMAAATFGYALLLLAAAMYAHLTLGHKAAAVQSASTAVLSYFAFIVGDTAALTLLRQRWLAFNVAERAAWAVFYVAVPFLLRWLLVALLVADAEDHRLRVARQRRAAVALRSRGGRNDRRGSAARALIHARSAPGDERRCRARRTAVARLGVRLR